MEDPRCLFFDSIAGQWDTWDDLAALAVKLDNGLASFGLRQDELVLDIGCGTGNLTCALLRRLGTKGRVIAIDISSRMLELAKGKVTDTRVQWYRTGAEKLPCPPESADRVICYSVWPHFQDANAAVREFQRVLKPGGILHIWHLIPRGKVNHIHENAEEAVRKDHLVSADDAASLLERAGFRVFDKIDNEERYLVTASKRNRGA